MPHVEMRYSETGWLCAVQKREDNVLLAGILFSTFGKAKDICDGSRCLGGRKQGTEERELVLGHVPYEIPTGFSHGSVQKTQEDKGKGWNGDIN